MEDGEVDFHGFNVEEIPLRKILYVVDGEVIQGHDNVSSEDDSESDADDEFTKGQDADDEVIEVQDESSEENSDNGKEVSLRKKMKKETKMQKKAKMEAIWRARGDALS